MNVSESTLFSFSTLEDRADYNHSLNRDWKSETFSAISTTMIFLFQTTRRTRPIQSFIMGTLAPTPVRPAFIPHGIKASLCVCVCARPHSHASTRAPARAAPAQLHPAQHRRSQSARTGHHGHGHGHGHCHCHGYSPASYGRSRVRGHEQDHDPHPTRHSKGGAGGGGPPHPIPPLLLHPTRAMDLQDDAGKGIGHGGRGGGGAFFDRKGRRAGAGAGVDGARSPLCGSKARGEGVLHTHMRACPLS
jgi:hypothetical protein